MREVEGIILTARNSDNLRTWWLFGPSSGSSEFSFEDFTTNGLVPFGDLDEAQKSLDELRRKGKSLGLVKMGLAEVKLKITESDDEMGLLAASRNLIVVAEIEGGVLLLGKSIKGVPGVCYAPVSDLLRNNLKTISKYDPEFDGYGGALYEVRRQGQIKAWLGTFVLTEIERS